MKSLFALLSCATTALAVSRTSAPAGCITVGSGGYSTIQAAVNSLSTSASGTQCIFISPGTYKEQVLVSARSAQLTIYGSTTDTSTYAANSVTITGSKSQADGLSNDETATLRVKAANFKLYNVNVANTYGKGSQAVALSAYADSGYYASAFTGYQDTLLANTGKQLYAGSLIQGATDFIFGQNAAAWFEDSDIRVVSASLGYVTGRSSNFGSGCRHGGNELINTILHSQRPIFLERHLLLRLQQLRRGRRNRQQRQQRRILPREAVGRVRSRGIPEDLYERRHQQRRMAHLEHGRRAHRPCPLWRVCEHGNGSLWHEGQLRDQA